MPTLQEVAQRSGVSTATVSRALRRLPNVAPSTRERVLRVAAELNYSLDAQASRLASGRTMTIAVVAPLAGQWFFTKLVTAIESALLETSYDLLYCSVADRAKQTSILRDLTTSNRVDGIIISTLNLRDRDIDLLASSDLPVVTIELQTEVFPSVGCDNYAAAETATRHLVNLGHRDIGVITGIQNDPLAFQVPHHRVGGYQRVLAEHDIPIRPELSIPGNFAPEGGAEAMTRLLSIHRPPTAVFALSDEMAIGAMKVIRDMGLRIPEDISVIGFDDHDLSAYLDLTTIAQPVESYGEAATSLLLEQIENPHLNVDDALLTTRLVVRGTTGPCRTHSA